MSHIITKGSSKAILCNDHRKSLSYQFHWYNEGQLYRHCAKGSCFKMDRGVFETTKIWCSLICSQWPVPDFTRNAIGLSLDHLERGELSGVWLTGEPSFRIYVCPFPPSAASRMLLATREPYGALKRALQPPCLLLSLSQARFNKSLFGRFKAARLRRTHWRRQAPGLCLS